MKKILVLLVVMLLAVTACSSPAASKEYKVGTYAMTAEPTVTPAAEKDGKVSDAKAQYSVVLVTVLLEDDVVKAINIDEAQNSATVNAEGVATVPTETPTKDEKKDAYNMRKASPIQKEWFEQIDALEAFLVGKKVDEVKGYKLDSDGVIEADVKSSVTIQLNDIMATVVKAIDVAEKVEGAPVKIGASSATTVKDTPVTADKAGKLAFDTNFSAVVLDKDGKVLHAYVDVMQNEVAYDAEGVLSAATKRDSKEIRKEDYGMLKASPIKKEWYEQATAYEAFLVGKTAADIKGVALEDGKPTGDLASSVTIIVTGLQDSVLKSIEKAVDLPAAK